MNSYRVCSQVRRFVCGAVVAGLLFLMIAPRGFAQPPVAPEKGKFRLHKFEQPIGEETYEITRQDNSLSTTMHFKFTDRGTAVPLEASFKSALDYTPQAFEIKGQTSRLSAIDQSVGIEAGQAHFRNHDQKQDLATPRQFFTIAGYAPVTMQMLLVRYWLEHGKPAVMPTLPAGEVRIQFRGQDKIERDDRASETIDRYLIEGLVWGREEVWLDAHRNLVAAVTLDAEFDHFEAVREDYESSLGMLVGRAGSDAMEALAAISSGISAGEARTLALSGATLIDGTGRAAILDSVVVIHDGKIIAAGPRSEVKIPKHAKVIDVGGKTILPGLWDMHAHFEQVEWGPVYLAAGVTTVRDCGNEFEFITAVRDAIAAGRGVGPRMLLAGIVDGSGPLSLGINRVDTPEQALTWVHRYHDAGFQQIKIYSSVKLEILKVITAEAHRMGMTVTGHIPEGMNAFQAIEAGQDQINHIGYIADILHAPLPADAGFRQRAEAELTIDLDAPDAKKALAFLKDHGTVVDPTIALSEFFTATAANPVASFEPGVNDVAPELKEQLTDAAPPSERSERRTKLFVKELAIIGALQKAGVPVVAGTDQTVPGHSLHREIELYVRAGFTPMEAIQAATIVPARVMGLGKETGSVEVGKRADLIVVEGDPLADIRNTRNVRYVISAGKVYDPVALWRSVGFHPWQDSGK